MAVSQVCREPEKSLAKHKTSFEGIWFRRHRVNGRERWTEAGRVFFKNPCMESNAGELTAEELKDRCKQDKIIHGEVDHYGSVHVCVCICTSACACICTCVCTSNLKHCCYYLA